MNSPSTTRRALLTSGAPALALSPLAGCSNLVRELVSNPVYDTTAADALSSAATPADPPRARVAPAAARRCSTTSSGAPSTSSGPPAIRPTAWCPDRYPSPSPASIAAVGFALTAYVIGADRGFITREQARERTLATVRFFRNAPQGPQARGKTGHKGFFYHFLDMKTGARAWRSELSTVDTALLLGGMLHAQAYFDADHPDEVEIRARRRRDLLAHRLEMGAGARRS